MGKGKKAISLNRAIEKIEDFCAFNMYSVDFESDFAYLLNSCKSIYDTEALTPYAKKFVTKIFSEVFRRKNPNISNIPVLKSMPDIDPDDVSLDLIPSFDFELVGEKTIEVVEGVRFFVRDSQVGVSSIAVGTTYKYTAANYKPLEPLTDEELGNNV